MALEGDKIAKPQFDLKLFWRLFTFGTPYINLIILGVFLIVLSSVAYIFNPHITFRELLLDIFRELDLKSRSDGPHEMVRQLHQYQPLSHDYVAI